MACPQYCIPSPRATGPLVPGKKIFKGFLLYMGVQFGHVTQDAGNESAFPIPIETPYEIWLWFLRRRRLKSVSYMSLCKTSDPRCGAIFDPGL